MAPCESQKTDLSNELTYNCSLMLPFLSLFTSKWVQFWKQNAHENSLFVFSIKIYVKLQWFKQFRELYTIVVSSKQSLIDKLDQVSIRLSPDSSH